MQIENKFLAVVVPVYNEMGSLKLFWHELTTVLNSISETSEVIFVNDGSTDASLEILKTFKGYNVKVINLLVNSGHMAALDAGLRNTKAKYVVTMDSDLQHPPEEIPKMLLAATKHNFDVVYAVRGSRSEERLLKRITASMYYKTLRNFSGVPIHQNAADFRLMSNRVLDVIQKLPPRAYVFRLLIPKLGFYSTTHEYVAAERIAGESKYGLRSMIKLGVLSVVNFSSRPLVFSVYLGVVFSLLSIIGLAYSLARFSSGNTVPGWASISSVLFLLFGILFFVLGITGTYLAEIWRRTSGIPDYFVDESEEITFSRSKDALI